MLCLIASKTAASAALLCFLDSPHLQVVLGPQAVVVLPLCGFRTFQAMVLLPPNAFTTAASTILLVLY